MERLENVATPALADTVVVPDRSAERGVGQMATSMRAAELVTELPKASCTATCTAGEMAAPAVALLGWTVKATFEAAAALMLKADEVAPVSGDDAAVSV